MSQTPPPYCWPGCNPKPGESACSCICRVLAFAEGISFEEVRRRRAIPPIGFKDKPFAACHSATAAADLLRAEQQSEIEARRESLGIPEGSGGYFDLLPGGID